MRARGSPERRDSHLGCRGDEITAVGHEDALVGQVLLQALTQRDRVDQLHVSFGLGVDLLGSFAIAGSQPVDPRA